MNRKIQWKDVTRSREFLNKFASSVGIKKPEDWGKIKSQQLIAFGGAGLIAYHHGSLLRALRFSFPGSEYTLTHKRKNKNGENNGFSMQSYLIGNIQKFNFFSFNDLQKNTIFYIQEIGEL